MCDTKEVKRVLRKLGFGYLTGTGGHEVWTDHNGRRVTPVLRHKNMNSGSLHCLAEQLEGLGVCTKSNFREAVRKS